MVFPRVGPGWHLRSWKAVPVCQTGHQAHSRHCGTNKDYSLTAAQKSNSPGPCVLTAADQGVGFFRRFSFGHYAGSGV